MKGKISRIKWKKEGEKQMAKDYIKILYEEWLEHLTKEPKTVTAANKVFHQYVEQCQQLKQEERNHISNYNGDCIAACEAFSFQAGFETACGLMKVMLGIKIA